jgi:hypothetical protein
MMEDLMIAVMSMLLILSLWVMVIGLDWTYGRIVGRKW